MKYLLNFVMLVLITTNVTHNTKATLNNVNLSQKDTVVNCYIREDSGELEMTLAGEQIKKFSYTNVGGGTHTCTLEAERGDQESIWKDSAETTTITFKEIKVVIVIEKTTQGYMISFSGEELSYFCGARAFLPAKLQLIKRAKAYIGKRLNS